MKKLQKNIKLSFEFLNKLLYEYIKSLLKYIGIAGFGLVILCLTIAYPNPILMLLSLFITIPAFCYAFWKGYVVTYALNFAAFEFYNSKPLKDFYHYIGLAKSQEKGLIGFVGFVAVVTMLAYIPSCVIFFSHLSIETLMIDPNGYKPDKETITAFTVTTLILAQLINFSLQAFFFRKKEGYFSLLVNCYKMTGISGFIISAVIVGLTSLLNFSQTVLYLLIFIPLNLLIYPFNTFWYFEGLKKKLLVKK